MILACISELIYNCDRLNHAVAYAEHCSDLALYYNDRACAPIAHVLAGSLDDARVKLAQCVRELLAAAEPEQLAPPDFSFRIGFSKLVDDRVMLPCADDGETCTAAYTRLAGL